MLRHDAVRQVIWERRKRIGEREYYRIGILFSHIYTLPATSQRRLNIRVLDRPIGKHYVIRRQATTILPSQIRAQMHSINGAVWIDIIAFSKVTNQFIMRIVRKQTRKHQL